MIAEDEQESPPSAAAPPQPLGAMPAMQDDSPSEPVASPAPSSGAGPTERSSSDASAAGQGPRSDGLLSPATTAALDAAFNTLAQTAQPRRRRTVEELVSELMRPMLRPGSTRICRRSSSGWCARKSNASRAHASEGGPPRT